MALSRSGFRVADIVAAKSDDVRADRASRYRQLACCDRQLEAARTGASRVDVENVITLGHGRYMRMTGYHDTDPCGARIDVELSDIVDHVDQDLADPQQLRSGQTFGPVAVIVVAAHDGKRSECRKLFENIGVADVAAVDDPVATIEER